MIELRDLCFLLLRLVKGPERDPPTPHSPVEGKKSRVQKWHGSLMRGLGSSREEGGVPQSVIIRNMNRSKSVVWSPDPLGWGEISPPGPGGVAAPLAVSRSDHTA